MGPGMGCRNRARDDQSLGSRCARRARSHDRIYEVGSTRRFTPRGNSAAKSSVDIGYASHTLVDEQLDYQLHCGKEFIALEIFGLSKTPKRSSEAGHGGHGAQLLIGSLRNYAKEELRVTQSTPQMHLIFLGPRFLVSFQTPLIWCRRPQNRIPKLIQFKSMDSI